MDEIDAIGGRRFSEGTSADREIQRTLMELLNQLDGFEELGKVKFYHLDTLIFLYMCKMAAQCT
jgi:ATP-dependent 26S proteasome regulatory subunit